MLTMQYQSCESYFLNQASTPLDYCRTDFVSRPPTRFLRAPALTHSWQSTLTNFLATNCQAQQNAHGGNCVANDKRWYVQVQHS